MSGTLTIDMLRAAVHMLAQDAAPTLDGFYTTHLSPRAAGELIIAEVWIDPGGYPSRRAWSRAMAPVFEPDYEVPTLGWGIPKGTLTILLERMARAWQRVARKRRAARKARRGWA